MKHADFFQALAAPKEHPVYRPFKGLMFQDVPMENTS